MTLKKVPSEKWRVTVELDRDTILKIREDCVINRISQKQLLYDIIKAYYTSKKLEGKVKT